MDGGIKRVIGRTLLQTGGNLSWLVTRITELVPRQIWKIANEHGIVPRMRQVLDDIEAGKLTEELQNRGIPPGQRLRVVVESIDDEDGLSITAINAAGGAFDWLADEPDLYSDADLVERYHA